MVYCSFTNKEAEQISTACPGHAAMGLSAQSVCKNLSIVLTYSHNFVMVMHLGCPSLEMWGGIRWGQAKGMKEMGEYC